ncbi:MAG TPA: glycosyltransferase family 2 protein [Methylomirabilota bacterium]|jgi:GT2 family glycosyltransferase
MLSPGSERPLVSAVVVNWNGADFVDACLASLLRQTWPALEIIVVDNGSRDGSRELLRARYGSRITLIESPVNLGFAGGNNLGIRAAKGAYLALLNNDAVAEPHWIAALVGASEADARVGMCASRILLLGGDGLVDSAGLLMSADGIGRGRGRLERDGAAFARAGDALVPSACAALYRRSMLDEIGLFDEDFFAYCEDSDLGLRGRLAGWTCRYVPDAVVHHAYSRSTAPYSTFKAFHVERNRCFVVLKCFPVSAILASIPFTIARYSLQAWGAATRRGAVGRLAEGTSPAAVAAVLLRAWAAAIMLAPRMLARRRRQRSLRRLTAAEWRRALRPHRLGLRELALKD